MHQRYYNSGDDCTETLLQNIAPMLKPAIMTPLVLKGVSVYYNEYYSSSLYLQNAKRFQQLYIHLQDLMVTGTTISVQVYLSR